MLEEILSKTTLTTHAMPGVICKYQAWIHFYTKNLETSEHQNFVFEMF